MDPATPLPATAHPAPTDTAGPQGSDAPLPGVLVGHDTIEHGPTGVTVVLLPEGTTVGVDVRGAAPGTRETDLLDPVNTIDVAHGLVLAGGSAFGLAAADGVMGWLEDQGRGVPVGPVRVPIVPAAVVFDLLVGDPAVRPDAAAGRRACAAAVPLREAAQGSVGAGAGASVGKVLGPDRAMRGGIGTATLMVGGVTTSALVVVNAVGDIVDPDTGQLVAGARTAPDALRLAGTVTALLAAGAPNHPAPPAGAATTIGVILTDAALTKAQATRLAQVAHDGLARSINPVHTPMDGDTLFVAGTGTAARPADIPVLSVMVAEVTARAVLSGVRAAVGLHRDGLWLPAAGDLGA